MLREKTTGINKFGYGFILLLLFLAAMNFYAKFFYFAFAATAVSVLVFSCVEINGIFFLYLFLGMIMAIYNVDNGIMSMLRCMTYAAVYYTGFAFSVNSGDKQLNSLKRNEVLQKRLYEMLCAVSLGSFAHFMLNYFSNLGKEVGRNTNDIWTGEMQAATGQTALACLMIGLSISMLLMPRKKYSRLIGIFAILGVLVYNLILAGRTVIVISLIALTLGFIFTVKATKQIDKKVKLFGWIIFFLILVFLIWNFNVGGIKDTFKDSNLYLRFFGTGADNLEESGRLERKTLFLKNMLDYPFGGLYLRDKYGYAHDLLLDGYDEYGFSVLILLIIILFNGIKNLLRFCKNSQIRLFVRTSFFCVYISVLLEFCVEPIFAGMQWLFVCFCLINGAIAGFNYYTKDFLSYKCGKEGLNIENY